MGGFGGSALLVAANALPKGAGVGAARGVDLPLAGAVLVLLAVYGLVLVVLVFGARSEPGVGTRRSSGVRPKVRDTATAGQAKWR